MKKKIFIVVLVLAIILSCLFSIYVFVRTPPKWNESIFNAPSLNKEDKKSSNQMLGIGKMTFTYSPEVGIEQNNDKYVSLSFPFKFKTEKNISSEKTFLNILFSKNNNEQKLSVEDWFKKLDIENEPHTPYLILREEKYINNNGIEIYKVTFYSSYLLGSYYYNPVIFYIPNGVEVYEIDSYELPEAIDPDLTQDEIQQAKEYEKSVNEIIQSINFVK